MSFTRVLGCLWTSFPTQGNNNICLHHYNQFPLCGISIKIKQKKKTYLFHHWCMDSFPKWTYLQSSRSYVTGRAGFSNVLSCLHFPPCHKGLQKETKSCFPRFPTQLTWLLIKVLPVGDTERSWRVWEKTKPDVTASSDVLEVSDPAHMGGCLRWGGSRQPEPAISQQTVSLLCLGGDSRHSRQSTNGLTRTPLVA